jgi:hypothetical protein
MKLKLYKLELGHEITYSKSFYEQYIKYKESGDSWKNMTEMVINVTPELVCAMLEGHDPTDFCTIDNPIQIEKKDSQ